MPITYDITKDGLYNRGIEQGRLEEKSLMIKEALNQNKLTLEEIANMARVDIDFVIKIQSELDK